ncbi:MAG: hypothetical protein R3188_02335 [Acidiferrobacterales bacterium]|nr:hypothetical protein [Acidiferrobacterales bacterium]
MKRTINGIGRRISFLVSITILIIACSKVENGSVDAGLDSVATWSVQLSVSGGFAGVRQQLEVNQNGRVIAVDEKFDKTITSILGSEDFTQIRKLVEWRTSTLSSSPEKLRGADCIDCFIYTLVSTLDGKKVSKQYGGLNLVDEHERQLIRILSKVLHEQLNRNR